MYRIVASFCLFCAIPLIAPSAIPAVTINTVPVGSPGNANNPGTPFGAVAYNYRIGAFDVTNAQYAEFLNAKAAADDPHRLWNSQMDPSIFEGAISRSGSGPYSYSVKPGYGNKPVVYVTWYSAIRFVNWLTNGQGAGDTENGSYTIDGLTVFTPTPEQRATWAVTASMHWLLPNRNEWYKAAYFNAMSATYSAFPFQSNSAPEALAPPGNANSGNFLDAAFNYDGTGSYLTDVGSYPNSMSHVGAFDMGGDVWQWNEESDDTEAGLIARYLRGASYPDMPSRSGASISNSSSVANGGFPNIGFRVARIDGVPEPSAGLLTVLACGLIWWKRKSFRRVA